MMKHKVVGYGSLMSHKSLEVTMHEKKKFKPVVVRGYKRVFNLKTNLLGKSDCLNVMKSPGNKFNAIVFSVDDVDLRKLKERETDYNVEETEAFDFSTGELVGKCLLFTDYLVGIDHSRKKPSKSYFKLCREAAYHLSKEFGKMWDETTFTSSGEKISDWIKSHPQYDFISSRAF